MRLPTSISIACAVGIAICPADQGSRWPIVRELHAQQIYSVPTSDTVDTPFLAFVKNVDGVAVYKLECHNGNYKGKSEIDFAGDFQCSLIAIKGREPTSWNLFATASKNERSTDWWNRGRMLALQLRRSGPCMGYPEYGAVRHFKVRGMLITLQFSNLEWSTPESGASPALKQFTFVVSVVSNKSSLTETSDEVHGAKPPRACY